MEENPYRGPDFDVAGQRKKSRFSPVLGVLTLLGLIVISFCLLAPLMRFGATGAARRNSCMNRLKSIGIALRQYADVYQSFPPAYTVDAEGKPLHSWRTLILPFLEQNELYRKIDLTKAWDDPANAEALKTSVDVYHCPAELDRDEIDNYTTYLAVVTPNSCLRAAEGRLEAEITDGLPFTLIVMEVDSEHAVPWMSPFDADEKMVLSIGPESKLAHSYGMHVLYAGGRVQFLDSSVPAKVRLAVISIAGDDNLTLESIE